MDNPKRRTKTKVVGSDGKLEGYKRIEFGSRFHFLGKNQSWAHPVVGGGRLYLRYDDNLYCFDVAADGRP